MPPRLLAERVERRAEDDLGYFPSAWHILLPGGNTFDQDIRLAMTASTLLAFDRARPAVIVQRHVGEVAIGDEDAADLVAPDHPRLDVYGDRRFADADQVGIDAHHVADEDRLAKRHGVHC